MLLANCHCRQCEGVFIGFDCFRANQLTAKRAQQPLARWGRMSSNSLTQAHSVVRSMTGSGPQLPLMAKNELIAIAKLQAEIAPQLPTFIFERRPQTTALRTSNLRAYSAG